MKRLFLALRGWYRSSRARLAVAGLFAACALALHACGGSDEAPPPEMRTQNCPEIFASGFRNPWRWSFDRMTGDLWLGDVGQSAREEIDRVVLGGNYGWRCFEGTLDTGFECGTEPNLLPPVAEYGRGVGTTVTGGYVYRGSTIAGLEGHYVFGDFGSQQIWHFDSNAAPPVQISGGFDSGLSIVSFAQGNDGELYVVDYAGPLYRLNGPLATLGVERVFQNLSFTQPVAMLQAPNDDSRWFVVEQGGIVRVFDNAPMVMTSTPFLSIVDRVDSGGETGLLGMAFHPHFPADPRVFVHYTNMDAGLVSRISEFRSSDNGGTLDPGSERILLVINQPEANHNGGHLAFGPDGFLYIGMGDGGGANDLGPLHGPIGNGQRMTTLLGKMLRIDVNRGSPYGIPPDNPFATGALCGAPP
jgi:glucose/arabinose dehydrogenase